MVKPASRAQPFRLAGLPLHGLRLVEASAGTGKTFSLAGLYLRLIVEQRADVRDILVITFTRAATQELRERIRAWLTEASRLARALDTADVKSTEQCPIQTLLLQAAETGEPLARRLTDAAARIDEATIVTIHSFAQLATTENAFESALAFDRGEAVDDASVYQEVVRDYWREHVFGAEAGASDLLALWPSPEALYKTIKPVLHRPHAGLAGVDPARVNRLLDQLAEHWPGSVEPLVDALAAAAASNALYAGSTLAAALTNYGGARAMVEALDRALNAAQAQGAVPVLPAWLTGLADPRSQFKQRPANARACAEPLTELAVCPLLAELQPLAQVAAIERTVAVVRERAASRKRARRQYSFDDLIVALYQALTDARTGPALADALHARWPYALVDEFQDTDPLQYASLSCIYLERPREHGALLLIGDPKQAIYGFRGGDIYAYLDAARAAGEARYTLTTNFRSTQGVLDAVEALFRPPGGDPFGVSAIDFPHIEAGRPAGDRRLVWHQRECPAVSVWRLVGGTTPHKNGKRKNPARDSDNRCLMAETVARIGRLLDPDAAQWQFEDGRTSAVAPSDIAVLVNSHREATMLQTTLASNGISAVCQHRASVFAAPEADDLRRVLRAMAQPDDAAAVRAAQPSALMGRQLSDCVQLADDEQALQAAIEIFHELHQTWRRKGVLAALERVFIDAAPRLLTLTTGERRMSNYLQLGELLASAEPECYGMASLNRWFDDGIATAHDAAATGLDDDSQLRLESDAELVRISTLHSAKGLEYPIVFLPFALWLGTTSPQNRSDKPPLVFHDADGRARIDLVGASEPNQKQAAIEARSENLRLLYVGLTRAAQALFIGWREPDDSGANGALADLLHRDGVTDDALAKWAARQPQAVAIETIDVAEPSPRFERDAPATAVPLLEARRDLPASRPPWATFSFSRLARSAPESVPAELPNPGAEDELVDAPSHDAPEADDERLPALDPRLAGVRFGSAVHDLLEAWVGDVDREPWPRPGQAAAPEQRTAVARSLRHHGLLGDSDNDRRAEDTIGLVARVLHTPLPDIGALAKLGANQTRTEMEFMLRLGGGRLDAIVAALRAAGYLSTPLAGRPDQTLSGLMQGFIDLVVEVDGRFYVLDYKTNHLGDTPAAYRGAALARAIARSHYDLQYLIYTVALHRQLRHCLGARYSPATHLGGVQYLFVRALDGETEAGVFSDRPDVELIETLDALFANETGPA